MKGHNPFEICKEDLELSSKHPSFFLELGAMQTPVCGCKAGECKGKQADEDTITLVHKEDK